MLPPTPPRVWVVADLLAELAALEWAQRPVTHTNLRDAIASLATETPFVGSLADNTAALNTLLATLGFGAKVSVPSDISIGTAPVQITKGIQLDGPGLVTYVPSATLGTRVQSPAGRDRYSWGSEYLYEFLVKVSSGVATTIRMSGDSTTVGGYSDALISQLASVPGVTPTKFGFTGEHTGQWVASHLAADIAAAPDVLIWHWGMNDCTGLGRTLAQFETDLRAGLTTYRAAIPIGSGGIVLMVPNASSDGLNGRDEFHFEKMRQIIRNCAMDFKCAYYDTYGFWQDAYVGIGTWIDNTYGDGLRGVHPQIAFSQAIAGELLNLLIPIGIRQAVGYYGFSNAFGIAQTATPTDALSTYVAGISIRRATVANGWPQEGWIITFVENSVKTSAVQILYTFNADVTPLIRTYSAGAWGTWGGLGISNVKSIAAPLASAASSTYPLGTSIRRATPGNGFPLDGFVETTREDNLSLYAIQVLHAYNADTPPQVRTWISSAAWSLWRSMSSVSIPATNSYKGVGNVSVTAHNIPLGIAYTHITNNTGAAAYTLTLPAATIDGAILTVVFTNATGAITYTVAAPATGTALLPATVAAGQVIRMRYNVADTTWGPA